MFFSWASASSDRHKTTDAAPLIPTGLTVRSYSIRAAYFESETFGRPLRQGRSWEPQGLAALVIEAESRCAVGLVNAPAA
jgi:hypothetical protein